MRMVGSDARYRSKYYITQTERFSSGPKFCVEV